MRSLIILLFLLLVVAAGIVVGLIGRSMLGGESRESGPSTRPVAAPSRTPDVPPVAQPDASRGEVVVDITEEELARELNARLGGQVIGSTPLGEASAEDLTARLRDGQIEIGGDARVGPARVPFTVIGTVGSNASGRPVARVSDARVGGAPMPEAARVQIEQTLQAELDRQLARRSVRVRSVEIGAGRLRIIGTLA